MSMKLLQLNHMRVLETYSMPIVVVEETWGEKQQMLLWFKFPLDKHSDFWTNPMF